VSSAAAVLGLRTFESGCELAFDPAADDVHDVFLLGRGQLPARLDAVISV
jgi:hypothetical protein